MKEQKWKLKDVILMAMLGILFAVIYLAIFDVGLAMQTALTPAGITGLIQGLGCELGFALFRYKRFDLLSMSIAGIFAALFIFTFELYYLQYYLLAPILLAGQLLVSFASAFVFSGVISKFACDKLNTELNTMNYHIGNIPVIGNTDNGYYNFDREEIIGKLTRQVCNPIYFEDIIKKQIREGFDTFIEVGPGKALSNFVKKTNNTVNIYSVQDEKSFDNIKRFFEIDSCDKQMA